MLSIPSYRDYNVINYDSRVFLVSTDFRAVIFDSGNFIILVTVIVFRMVKLQFGKSILIGSYQRDGIFHLYGYCQLL